MKIGYYYPAPFPTLNADIVHIVQMCRAFSALGHDVTLFIPRADEYADETIALQKAGELFGEPLLFDVAFIQRRTLFGRFQTLGSIFSARKALRKHVLDLVYTRAPWAMLFLPFQPTPFVYEAHELEMHREFSLLNWFLQPMIVFGSKRPACKKFVAISAALKNEWRKLGVPAEKMLVAHDAVDLAMFEPPLSKVQARTKLGLNPRRPVIVYTGSLYEDRGIDLILHAAARLQSAEFYLVGGAGGDVNQWRKRAEDWSLANVKFVGQVPHREVPVWLAAADIQLMMWTWKVRTIAICSPMKLFEYMAAERLIVGPAFPTITEVVRDGEHAILFEPDNLEAMIAALEKAITLIDKSDMPASARQLVEQHYTWEKRAASILKEVSVAG